MLLFVFFFEKHGNFFIIPTVNMNENELIASAKSGAKEAFEELVILYQHRMYAYCWQRLFYNGSDALDASQLTFIKAYKGLRNFREDASFFTWLCAIARNVCWDLREKKKSQPEIQQDFESLPSNGDAAPGPEAQCINRDLVKKCVSQLNEKRQEIIFLIYFQELKYGEAAKHMGLKTGTLKSNLQRALGKLKECISSLSD